MIRRRLGETLAITTAIILLISSSSIALDYKVKKGDTLWKVARRHNISIASLAKANGISEEAKLKLGQVISIPIGKESKKKCESNVLNRETTYYVHIIVENSCLRSEPGTDNPKIAALQPKTNAKLLGRVGNWAKVELEDGVCGYIHKSLIRPGIYKPSDSDSSIQSSQCDNSSLVRTALSYRGASYRRGGTGKNGFDCSGFTSYVYSKYGISLPHSSASQFNYGKPVSREDLKPGDLVFFNRTYKRGISHVGIYIGNNQFVHAATYGRGVRVDSLSSKYYASRYCGARRIK